MTKLILSTLALLASFTLQADNTNRPFVLSPGRGSAATPSTPVIQGTNGLIISPTNMTVQHDLVVQHNIITSNSVTVHGGVVVDNGVAASGPLVGESLAVVSNIVMGVNGMFIGNGTSLTNLQLKISGTNSSSPSDTSTIKAWINVTLPDGHVMKSPVYE